MGTSNNYTSFNTIIKGAIDNFNSIHNAIRSKGGTNINNSALDATGFGTAVADYSTIIQNQLWTVAAPGNGQGIINNSLFNGGQGTISNFDATTLHLTLNQTSSYENGNVTITGKVNNHGYFTEDTVFSYSLAGTVLSVTGSLKLLTTDWPLTSGKFEYVPSANTLISKVQIDKGTISVSSNGISSSNESIDSTRTITNTTDSLLIGLNSTAGLGSDPYSFTFNTSTSANAQLSTNATVSVTKAGYISDTADITGGDTGSSNILNISKEISASEGDLHITGSTTDTLYIKKGSVNIGNISGGTLSLTPSNDISYETSVANAANYVSVNAAISAFEFPNAQISEGYFKDEALSISGQASSSTIYIAKGSTENVTIPVTLSVTSNPNSIITNAASGYSVTISNGDTNNEESVTGVVHPGYSNQTQYNAKATGLTKTLTIPAASITTTNGTLTVSGVTVSGGVAAFGTGTSDGYAFKINASMPISVNSKTGLTQGYIKETSQVHLTALNNTAANNTLYVKKGSATYTPGLTFTLTDNSGNGDGDFSNVTTGSPATAHSFSVTDLFQTTQPGSGKDYWTITNAITNNSFQEGYFKSGDVSLSAGQTYYLPKAELEWVENGNNGEDFLQVKAPGYLPSGVLTDISTVSLGLASAQAHLSFGSSNSDFITDAAGSGATANYAISISKGTINAGYFSATQGTLALDGTYYLKHGAATITATLGTPSITGLSWDSTSNKYEATISASVTAAKSSVTQGFIKSDDISLVEDSSATATLQLDKIGLAVSGAALGTGGVSDALSLSNMSADTSANPTYAVNVNLGALNHKLQAVVSSAGYGVIGDDSIQYDLTGTGTIGIKAATIEEEIHGNVAMTFKNVNASGKITSTSSGGYYTLNPEISPTLSFKVAEGYVGSTGISSSNVTGVTRGTLTNANIAQGSATYTGTGTASLTGVQTGTGSNIVTPVIVSSKTNGVDYVELQATATVNTTQTSFNEGYIKSTDVTLNNVTGNTSYYIQRISQQTSTTTLGSGQTERTVYTKEIDVDSELLIANQYSDKNYLITIGPNAAGTKVQGDLDILSRRLAGTLTQSQYNDAFTVSS